MKKMVASLVVLACVAPAMAANVTVSSPNPGEILLTADAGIVGIALTVDGVSVSDVTVDSFFDVFIDSMYSNAGYVIGQGVPTALQSGPGELALPSASFSISVGGLDDDGIGAGTEEAPTSVLITLEGDAGSVTVDEDTLRGGIVGYDGAMATFGLPMEIDFFPFDEFPPCRAEDSANWVAVGRPYSWLWQRQCHGDADNAQEPFGRSGSVWVGYNDIAILVSSFRKPDPDLAADFNRRSEPFGRSGSVRVGYDDIAVLVAYFRKTVPADCMACP